MEGNAVTNRDLIASVKNLASLASLQRSLVSVLYLVERKCFSLDYSRGLFLNSVHFDLNPGNTWMCCRLQLRTRQLLLRQKCRRLFHNRFLTTIKPPSFTGDGLVNIYSSFHLSIQTIPKLLKTYEQLSAAILLSWLFNAPCKL
jgi:hypothetical protein